MDADSERTVQAARSLDAWGWARDWQGSDPYDGLNTTRVLTPLKGSWRGRQVLMQVVKRSPVNLRNVLKVRSGPNAAALAWILSAYSAADLHPAGLQRQRRDEILGRLLDLRLTSWDEPCWGYHYDMQSRFLHYTSTTPNVIATSFAAGALLDLYERTSDANLLDLAEGVGRFLISSITQTADPPGAYFGYHVGDASPVHNANLHVAAVLARISAQTSNAKWMAAARDGALWSVARQHKDGSWPYGELSNLGWVDGFHTGYVLDSLQTCWEAGMDLDLEGPWRKGLAYWRSRMFLPDGTPRYYSTSTYPVDAQSVAQGMQTFARAAAHDPSCLDDAERVFAYSQRRMHRRDGAYFFQRRRFWVNRVAHVRGANAEMLLGFARLIAAQQQATSGQISG
jgi:hypothetical protein